MDQPTPESPDSASSWDTYWRGTAEAGAYSSGGAGHPALRAYWTRFFEAMKSRYAAPAMLDLATGNGAVVEVALEVFGDPPPAITCADISESAIANIESRFPGVRGVVTDARCMPLEPGSFDVVTSQFGIEYAGPEAFAEAGRVLAPGGTLALLMHITEGTIHDECSRSLDAVGKLRESRFIALATDMFQSGFDAVRGADRGPYERAAGRFAPSVQAVEDLLAQHGPGVADGTIARLYGDVARMHENIQRYDPAEVLAWLERMEAEMEAYAERVSSMRGAATNRETFEKIRDDLEAQGVVASEAGPFLVPGHELPLAWALQARRG